MDASVQQRTPRTARTSPVLRIVDASRVLLHEDPDPERVQRLVQAFGRDDVLRNPPIATSGVGVREFPSGASQLVVLDGANRVSALREIGASHLAVQVVDYGSPEISVSTWTHYVVEDGEPLRKRIAARLGIRVVPATAPEEAERHVSGGDGIAALLDAAGAAIVGPGLDPVANVALLGGLVGLYAGTNQVYRIDGRDIEAWRREYGRGTAVVFPAFGKNDILELATAGTRLPAGITRHLIPGRVLRLNVPLGWLRGPEGAAVRQSRLDEAVAARWRAHGVRYYAEATYLFDE